MVASVLKPPASSVLRNVSRTPCAPPHGCTAVVVVSSAVVVVVLEEVVVDDPARRASEPFPLVNNRTAPPARSNSKINPSRTNRRRFADTTTS